MARTTIDIDASVLRQIKRIARERGTSMTQVVSELLATALGAEPKRPVRAPAFRWETRAMRARVDLDDKDAVFAALDRG